MSSINQKLGLKPATRTRRATHGSQIQSGVSCPQCRHQGALRTVSENGRRAGEFWCGWCAHFWHARTA